jgi:membrane protease YdiL (CAAX protease family)
MKSAFSNRAIVYYVITLGLAILVRLAVPLIGEASLPVTMLTPAIATAIMLLLVAPEGNFRKAVVSLGLAEAGLKGWPFAIGGPAVIHGLGLAILFALGLTTLATLQMAGSTVSIVLDILAGFLIGTAFALGEEVGWRGYMLPRMKGLSLTGAMLVVGFLHGLWHMPILLTTDYYHNTGNLWLVAPLFLLTLTLAGVFYGFLRVWTGSVWPVAIAHAAANTAWNISSQLSQTKSPTVSEYVGGESGIIMISGLLVICLVLYKIMHNGKFENRAF